MLDNNLADEWDFFHEESNVFVESIESMTGHLLYFLDVIELRDDDGAFMGDFFELLVILMCMKILISLCILLGVYSTEAIFDDIGE